MSRDDCLYLSSRRLRREDKSIYVAVVAVFADGGGCGANVKAELIEQNKKLTNRFFPVSGLGDAIDALQDDAGISFKFPVDRVPPRSGGHLVRTDLSLEVDYPDPGTAESGADDPCLAVGVVQVI